MIITLLLWSIANNFVIGVYFRCLEILSQIAFSSIANYFRIYRKKQFGIESLVGSLNSVECYMYTWCISISLIALNVFQMQDSKIFSRRCKGCQIKYLFNWFYLDLAVCVHTNTSNSVQEAFLPSLVFTIFLAPYRGLNWQYMHIWSDSVIILKRGGQQKQKKINKSLLLATEMMVIQRANIMGPLQSHTVQGQNRVFPVQ